MFIETILHHWEQTIKRATAAFDQYDDEEYLKQILPGKNRVIYLLGHLTAVHDRMLPLLGLGERKFPHLDATYITSPDNPDLAAETSEIATLKKQWIEVNEALTNGLRQWTAEEWLQRHTAVSEADFAKEPHRNRFGLVINRAAHVSYHLGQLVWLKK